MRLAPLAPELVLPTKSKTRTIPTPKTPPIDDTATNGETTIPAAVTTPHEAGITPTSFSPLSQSAEVDPPLVQNPEENVATRYDPETERKKMSPEQLNAIVDDLTTQDHIEHGITNSETLKNLELERTT